VLDGDGLIFRITLDENGDSYFTSRFVETPCFLKEEKVRRERISTLGYPTLQF
jgi:carotenoid cleavage dioxygenase-like enzyme